MAKAAKAEVQRLHETYPSMKRESRENMDWLSGPRGPRQPCPKMLRRREALAAIYDETMTHKRLADHFGVSRGRISQDLAALRAEGRI